MIKLKHQMEFPWLFFNSRFNHVLVFIISLGEKILSLEELCLIGQIFKIMINLELIWLQAISGGFLLKQF